MNDVNAIKPTVALRQGAPDVSSTTANMFVSTGVSRNPTSTGQHRTVLKVSLDKPPPKEYLLDFFIFFFFLIFFSFFLLMTLLLSVNIVYQKSESVQVGVAERELMHPIGCL